MPPTQDISTLTCLVERHVSVKGNHRKATEIKAGGKVFLGEYVGFGEKRTVHQPTAPTRVQLCRFDRKHPS